MMSQIGWSVPASIEASSFPDQWHVRCCRRRRWTEPRDREDREGRAGSGGELRRGLAAPSAGVYKNRENNPMQTRNVPLAPRPDPRRKWSAVAVQPKSHRCRDMAGSKDQAVFV
jgi:hypothetical protein